MIRFTKAIHKEQFQLIATLANTIWREHYIPIIGKPQVEYMLQKFQSANAIAHQIEEKFEYYIIQLTDADVGYFSIKKEGKSLFLSKIYIQKSNRNLGIGKLTMQFIEDRAKNLDCHTLTLTVNKNNTNSIEAYKKLGFINRGAVVKDIGNNFLMDDYHMDKTLI